MNAIFSTSSIILTITMVIIGLFVSSYLWKINKKNEVPNLWTSLGILFTFISFVYAFGSIQNWNDDKLLELLIPNISAAFLTSIIGIFTSKVITIILKNQENTEETDEKFESPEMVLVSMRNIMAELKDVVVLNNANNEKVLKKITDTFNEFAGQVGMSISTNIENVMAETMTQMNKTIQSIGEKIDNNVNNQFEQQQSNIEQLTKSNNELLEKQTKSTYEISQTINDNLESVISSFKTAFDGNVAEITKVFDRLEKWSSALEGKNATINEKFANLVNIQSSREDVISKEIANQKTELKEMTEIMKKIVVSMENLPSDTDKNSINFELINSKLDKLIEKAA